MVANTLLTQCLHILQGKSETDTVSGYIKLLITELCCSVCQLVCPFCLSVFCLSQPLGPSVSPCLSLSMLQCFIHVHVISPIFQTFVLTGKQCKMAVRFDFLDSDDLDRVIVTVGMVFRNTFVAMFRDPVDVTDLYIRLY